MAKRASGRDWTFLTNHGHVLLCLATDPDVLLKDVARSVGITERAAQLIVSDLEEAGYITRTRMGRRNHYTIEKGGNLRHPLEAHRTVEVLLDISPIPSIRPGS
ncbi:MAG: helix-turn-helix transcriptional regulator [Nocardioides sp.]